MPEGPHCHNTLTRLQILIDSVHLTDLRIRWKFPVTLENLLGEDINLHNLIKCLHDIDLSD